MNQAESVHKIQALKPKGFALVVGLCVFFGFFALFAKSVLWFSPFDKTLSSKLSVHSMVGIIQSLLDLGLLLGGIYVLKKQNWARLLILATAVAKIFDWIYGAVVYRWLLTVLSLAIWSLPSLLMAIGIAIYFSRPSVKAYMV